MRGRSINIPRSITSVAKNDEGHLIITYRDGSTMDAGYVVGPMGVGIQSGGVDDAGNLSLKLTDGTALGPWLVKGKDGKNAQQPTFTSALDLTAYGTPPTSKLTSADGVAYTLAITLPRARDGVDGVGIASATFDVSGVLTLTLTNGAKSSGNLTGPPGPTGVVTADLPLTYDAAARKLSIGAASQTANGYMSADQAKTLATVAAKSVQVRSGVRVVTLTIAANATTTITIPFGTTMPDANYTVDVSFDGVGLATANWSITKTTLAAGGVTVTVKNAGVALAAAITFLAVAVRYA